MWRAFGIIWESLRGNFGLRGAPGVLLDALGRSKGHLVRFVCNFEAPLKQFLMHVGSFLVFFYAKSNKMFEREFI